MAFLGGTCEGLALPTHLPTNPMDKLDYRGRGSSRRWQLPTSRRAGKLAPMEHAEQPEQAELAQRLAHMLNTGVLQDAVAAGLEEQGQFKIDTLDLLDALESAGLTLAPRPPAS